MKTIPNVTFSIKAAREDSENATTASLLKITLGQAPAQGFDLATMRARNRVTDVLDKVAPGGEIQLEDADYAVARKCVEDYKWGVNHKDLVKFAEQFGL